MKEKTAPQKGLSETELIILGQLLERVAFPLPCLVFDGWVENLPTVALELGIVRQSIEGAQLFMKQRPEDDKHWPLEWHIPGTVIRQNELTSETYQRLLSAEVGEHLHSGFGPLEFAGIAEFRKGDGNDECRRGHEIALIHVVRFRGGNSLYGKLVSLFGTARTNHRFPSEHHRNHPKIPESIVISSGRSGLFRSALLFYSLQNHQGVKPAHVRAEPCA